MAGVFETLAGDLDFEDFLAGDSFFAGEGEDCFLADFLTVDFSFFAVAGFFGEGDSGASCGLMTDLFLVENLRGSGEGDGDAYLPEDLLGDFAGDLS